MNRHPSRTPSIYDVPPIADELWLMERIVKYYGGNPLDIVTNLDVMPYSLFCSLADNIIYESKRNANQR